MAKAKAKRGWFGRQPVGVRAALIGGGAVVIAAVVALLPRIEIGPRASLELVEILARDAPAGTELDVKLLNSGERVAFLRRVELEVDTLVDGVSFCCFEPVTATYHLRVDEPRAVSVSHAIPPNGVDRLRVVVGGHGPGVGVYRVRLRFLYNPRGVLVSAPFELKVIDAEPGEHLPVAWLPDTAGTSIADGWRDVLENPSVGPLLTVIPEGDSVPIPLSEVLDTSIYSRIR